MQREKEQTRRIETYEGSEQQRALTPVILLQQITALLLVVTGGAFGEENSVLDLHRELRKLLYFITYK